MTRLTLPNYVRLSVSNLLQTSIAQMTRYINIFSIYTLSDLGVLSNLIGSLSLANEHYSPIYTLSDLGVLSNLIGSLSLANEHYSPPTE